MKGYLWIQYKIKTKSVREEPGSLNFQKLGIIYLLSKPITSGIRAAFLKYGGRYQIYSAFWASNIVEGRHNKIERQLGEAGKRHSWNSRNPTPTATRDNRDTRKPAPHSAADRDIDTADRPIDKGSYPRTNHTLGISKVWWIWGKWMDLAGPTVLWLLPHSWASKGPAGLIPNGR